MIKSKENLKKKYPVVNFNKAQGALAKRALLKSTNRVYLDYASATPVDPKVISAMTKIMKSDFANASAIHDLGIKNKKILDGAREEVAKILNAHSDEIVFTSGATESNNLAIMGVIEKYLEIFSDPTLHPPLTKGRVGEGCIPHIITTNIEHSSILETCKHLEKTGQAEVTYVGVEANGIIDPVRIKKALKQNTVLVSVMYANNETGTIQPIREIAKEIRHFKKNIKTENSDLTLRPPLTKERVGEGCIPLFHIDATQAINYLEISNIEKLGVDLMSFNAGKIYGPKGIGVLFVKRRTPINKIIFGGDQELGLRPGTENLAGVVGLVEALKITEKIKNKEAKRLINLRDYFVGKLSKLKNQKSKFSRVLGSPGPTPARPLQNFIFDFSINGDLKNSLPNNINISISKIPSDLLVIELSARGIYVSEKSACKSGDKAGSYVIQAIREASGNKGQNTGSLRFSLGRQTTKADIDYVVKNISKILTKLERWYTR